MINETRNELLTILSLTKNGEDNRKFYTKLLLERFEYDLEDRQKELEGKLHEVKENKELLEYVRQEIEKESE